MRIWWLNVFTDASISNRFSKLTLWVLITVAVVESGKSFAAWNLWLCTTIWKAQYSFYKRKGPTTAQLEMYPRVLWFVYKFVYIAVSLLEVMLHLDFVCRGCCNRLILLLARRALKWWTAGVKTLRYVNFSFAFALTVFVLQILELEQFSRQHAENCLFSSECHLIQTCHLHLELTFHRHRR